MIKIIGHEMTVQEITGIIVTDHSETIAITEITEIVTIGEFYSKI